jgi:nucleoside-diphosphate-sugar epimerase
MRVVVIDGTGLIGSKVVATLQAQGHSCDGTSNEAATRASLSPTPTFVTSIPSSTSGRDVVRLAPADDRER